MFGNKRTLLRADRNKGLEIRAWLSLVVSEKRNNYFITEVEELRARKKEI
jgi:hypothetical protein